MYLPVVTCDKKESSFGYEGSHAHRGRVNIGDFC